MMMSVSDDGQRPLELHCSDQPIYRASLQVLKMSLSGCAHQPCWQPQMRQWSGIAAARPTLAKGP